MRLLLIGLLALSLAACGGSESGESSRPQASTETMAAMETVTATSTVVATATITPEATNTPSPTRTPTPTPTPEPICSTKDGNKSFDLLQEFSQDWDDAANLANSTPRMQLAAQIENLQGVRRSVQRQEWPECAVPAQQQLLSAMESAINGFIAFLSQRPDAEVSGYFDDYRDALDKFVREMAKIR